MVTERKTRPKFPLPQGHYFSTPTSSRNSHSDGPGVEAIQKAVGIEALGVYDNATREAVMQFQRKHKLDVTGVVEESTWKKFPLS